MTKFTAPSPEVQYITTIFRKISGGVIKLPAFQRDLVWKEKDVLELLESVYNGYPIGSLLFWLSNSDRFQTEKDINHPFPKVETTGSVSWIIDGMQRLSTLYGVFNWEPSWGKQLEHFNVWFDLSKSSFFVYDQKKIVHDMDRSLSLSGLFTSRKVLSDHQRFLSLPDADALIESSLKLQTVFQEYMIPTVTLNDYPVEEIVKVFERINSTGVKLTVSQFMRAITWSSDFDLDDEIKRSMSKYNLDGFGIKGETFTKSVSILSNGGISPESITQLRNVDKQNLSLMIDQAGEIFRNVAKFLEMDFKMYNARFLPYEGQLLFLFKLFSSNTSIGVVEAAKTWLWRTSFSEALRGKPDTYVQRHLNNLESAMRGNIKEIEEQFTLSTVDLQERRFNFGSALSSAMSAMFASREARDFWSNTIIPYESYMDGHNSIWFQPVVQMQNLPYINEKRTTSAKLLANLVIVPPNMQDMYNEDYDLATTVSNLYENGVHEEALESQFINSTCIEHLYNGRYHDFIVERSRLMLEYAKALSNYTSPEL